MNPLIRLRDFGQSVWYDNIRRSLVTSGELARMTKDYGLTGITSNPVIFEKAISGGEEYDPDIKRLAGEGKDADAILTELMIEDIGSAADELRGVYDETGGDDGYVSIEVRPGLARDAEGSVEEAERLLSAIDRPNVMVKIPGTKEGLEAIEELLYRGHNVNVTLLFSVKRYAEVAMTFVRAIERRAEEGKPVDKIFSVASFFVSRVDTLVDRLIEERAEKASTNDEKARLHELEGKTAVANAKLAYLKHEEVFGTDRFQHLAAENKARHQKLLWASTSTKNPAYSDTMYVTELMAPETINTMPLATLHAFEDHGTVEETLTRGLDEAGEVMEKLKDLGFDYDEITAALEDEGIEGFAEGFDKLLSGIDGKVKALADAGAASASGVGFRLGGYSAEVDKVVERLDRENFTERLWEKDASLWKDTREDREVIKNALGWLALPRTMPASVESIQAFAEEVKGALFAHVVVLGMGGSSLAPLVMAETFGRGEGWPELLVLDSTDPDSVRAVTDRVDLGKTLFIVASKSGTTIEPLSMFEYFHGLLKKEVGDEAGRNFIAITDPGTPLEGFSRKYGFRHLFLNPADIGGRFSALSYFGLVPAALAGVDIAKLLDYAGRVEESAQPCIETANDPGAYLGAVIGALGLSGRDKLTFSISPGMETFGLWIEQLIAESTGKEGRGLVPVAGEPLGTPADYGDDRVFVRIGLGRTPGETAARLDELAAAGHPVIEFNLADPHELGGEFLRWELATAAAGVVLGINPFDQPDVELAKSLTRSRLDSAAGGEPEIPGTVIEGEGRIRRFVFGPSAAEAVSDTAAFRGRDPKGTLRELLGRVTRGDYVGLLSYTSTFNGAIEARLREVQRAVRDATGAAVQLGFGPRYLHSTGQLHKGGPDRGVFIIITHDAEDLEIPGSRFGFSMLQLSQAYGDMEALGSRERRVVLIHLADGSMESLDQAAALIKAAAAREKLKATSENCSFP